MGENKDAQLTAFAWMFGSSGAALLYRSTLLTRLYRETKGRVKHLSVVMYIAAEIHSGGNNGACMRVAGVACRSSREELNAKAIFDVM